MDAFARNEALFLLHLLAYEVLHIGRRLLETATKTGWSLRRMRERVLRVGGRVHVHARRAKLVVAEAKAPACPLRPHGRPSAAGRRAGAAAMRCAAKGRRVALKKL